MGWNRLLLNNVRSKLTAQLTSCSGTECPVVPLFVLGQGKRSPWFIFRRSPSKIILLLILYTMEERWCPNKKSSCYEGICSGQLKMDKGHWKRDQAFWWNLSKIMQINFLVLIMHSGCVRCCHCGKLGDGYLGPLLYYIFAAFYESIIISQ